MMAMTDDGKSLVRDVGRRIAELRASKKLTQEKFAELLGIELRNVQRLERGANVTLLTLSAVAGALGVRPIELFEPPASRVVRRGRPRRADQEPTVASPEAPGQGDVDVRGDGVRPAKPEESAVGSRTLGDCEQTTIGSAPVTSPSELSILRGEAASDGEEVLLHFGRMISPSRDDDESAGHAAVDEALRNLRKLNDATLRINQPALAEERRWQDAALFSRRLMAFLPGIADALENSGPGERRDILVAQMEGMRAQYYSEKEWTSVVKTTIVRGVQLVAEHRVPDVLAVVRSQLKSEELAGFDGVLAIYRDPLPLVDAHVRNISSYYADLLLQQPDLLREAVLTWPAGPGRSSRRSKWRVFADLFEAIGIGESNAKSILHEWSKAGSKISSAWGLPDLKAVNARLRRGVWNELVLRLCLVDVAEFSAGMLEGIWVRLARNDNT